MKENKYIVAFSVKLNNSNIYLIELIQFNYNFLKLLPTLYFKLKL